jgi:serine/threonine protein kinase
MNYPLISEYVEAIKAAGDNFDKLKNLRPVLDDDEQPVMSSGNFAVVFKMKDEKIGKYHAVKCFLREQEGRAEAYRQIAEELEYVSSTYLTPIKYLDKELFVDTSNSDESEFPVLLMDWVEGKTIEELLRYNPPSDFIYDIAYRFSKFALWMISQPFAHGDLKPDNIIIKDNGDITLVDYDGMFVPAMIGSKARENGTPNYRDPIRSELPFDEHIDDFSLVILALSLILIAKNHNLYKLRGHDGLIFSESDFMNFKESDSYLETRKYKEDPYIGALFAILERLLSNHTIDKRDIQGLRIPPKQNWNSTIVFSSTAIALLNNYLWKIKDSNYIRDLNLNERIIEICPLNSDKKSYLRVCRGDTSEILEFLVCDGDKTGYSTISIRELKSTMLSLNMWDNGIENKIKVIQSI